MGPFDGLIFTATILDGLVLLFVGYEVVIGELRRRAETTGAPPPARTITMRLGLFIVLVASALFAVVIIGHHELASPPSQVPMALQWSGTSILTPQQQKTAEIVSITKKLSSDEKGQLRGTLFRLSGILDKGRTIVDAGREARQSIGYHITTATYPENLNEDIERLRAVTEIDLRFDDDIRSISFQSYFSAELGYVLDKVNQAGVLRRAAADFIQKLGVFQKLPKAAQAVSSTLLEPEVTLFAASVNEFSATLGEYQTRMEAIKEAAQ